MWTMSAVTNPFLGGNATRTATGSGFIVSPDGMIFTNDHVIEGASRIQVTLPDGRSFEATVTNADAAHDFAVLKVDGSDLPTVSLGESSALQLGQSVSRSATRADWDGGPSVTSGIISSLERTVRAQDANVGSADNIGFAISIDAAKSFIASAVAGT